MTPSPDALKALFQEQAVKCPACNTPYTLHDPLGASSLGKHHAVTCRCPDSPYTAPMTHLGVLRGPSPSLHEPKQYCPHDGAELVGMEVDDRILPNRPAAMPRDWCPWCGGEYGGEYGTAAEP